MSFRSQLSVAFLTIILLLSSTFAVAQNQFLQIDSVGSNMIRFNEMPTVMAQTRASMYAQLDAMMSYQDIEIIHGKADTMTSEIREYMALVIEQSNKKQSVRYIENSRLQLQEEQKELNELSRQLSDEMTHLSEVGDDIKLQKSKWINTYEQLLDDSYSETMMAYVEGVLVFMDSVYYESAKRSEEIFYILEDCANAEVDLEGLLVDLNTQLGILEDGSYAVKTPFILSLKFNPETTAFMSLINNYVKVTVHDINNYFRLRHANVVVFFLMLFLFIYLFKYYKGGVADVSSITANHYQKMLALVLKTPIFAALLLTIFLSSVFFKQRPIAIQDIMLYLLVLPLVFICRTLVAKRFHKYVIASACLLLSVIAFRIFPHHNVFFRYSILLLSVCEGLIVYFFYRNEIVNGTHLKGKRLQLIRGITIAFLALSVVSFVCSIIGQTHISQILLLTTFYSTYSAAILYCCSIMLNGIFITLIQDPKAKQFIVLTTYKVILIRKFIWMINTLSLITWLVISLDQLKIWDPIWNSLVIVFDSKWEVGAFQINIGNILVFFVVIYISTVLSKVIQVLLEGEVLSRMRLGKGVPHSISVMVRYTLVLLGVVLATSMVGIEFSNFAVVLGALGVGIGFGLQSIFNNLVSGLILLFERPVKIGDIIEIGDLLGSVTNIGLRVSNVRTVDGAEVIVPNGNLISNEVINWTLSDKHRRIELFVGVGYDSDPEQVKALFMSVLESHPKISKDPAPSVYFMEMGASSLDFRLLFWTPSYDEWVEIRSDIVMSTFKILNENNIKIPFPQREISFLPTEDTLPEEAFDKAKP